MNEQDLRYVKTEKLLRDSYIKLKERNSSMVIRLVDLCSVAMINKTTFYKHYETLEDFEDVFFHEVMKGILLKNKNIDKAFSDTEAFVKSTIHIMKASIDYIKILFSKNINKLITVVEDILNEIYLKNENDHKKKIQISYAIGGGAHVLIRTMENDDVQIIIDLIKATMNV